jgi:stage IV sporulation protein B
MWEKSYRCVYVLLGAWMLFSWGLMNTYLPDEIYVSYDGEEQQLADRGLPVVLKEQETTAPVSEFGQGRAGQSADHTITCRLFDLIPVKTVMVHVQERPSLLAAGTNIGIYLKNEGVLVVECGSFTDAVGDSASPAAYRVKSGDVIYAANGTAVNSKEELMDVINQGEGRPITLDLSRDGKALTVSVTPRKATDGKLKLGLWVRDDLAGIGTLTYVTEDGTYGALGHGVSDIDTGLLLQIGDGSIYETSITGITRGKKGSPGEVTGVISFEKENCLGTIAVNSELGIYGSLEQQPQALEDVDTLPIAYKQEIEEGKAQIICSVGGTRTAYDIEIEAVDYHAKEDNKGIRYQVVDEDLLELTGGIIQGMSGSPIVQNGHIIGAVTHVFVDDPTKGYGIFIETMLEQ